MLLQRCILTLAAYGATFIALSKLSGPMPETRAEPRHMPYASLRGTVESDAAKSRGEATTNGVTAEPDDLAAEADKLESFKQALFAAFVAAPKSGIPTALVDLAATYTSVLRLQLTLRNYSAVPTKITKAPIFTTGRAK